MPLTIKRTNSTSIETNSVQFNGTSRYLRVANNAVLIPGLLDFTIEGWVNLTSYSDVNFLYSKGVDSSDAASIGFGVAITTGKLWATFNADNIIITGATTLSLNTWYHIAITRQSNIVRMWLDGVQDSTNTTVSNNISTTTEVRIGRGRGTSTNYFNGYISNFRFVRGTALYTSTFDPSTVPLTAIANTQLLTCQSATIIDNSPNNFAITNNGSSTVSSFSPFATPSINNFQFARRTSTLSGKSVSFNGSTQYLSIPGNAAFAFGTGNFTIEWWQYMTSQPSNPRVFSIGNYASATIGVSIEGGTFYVWENSGVRFNYSLTADGYLNRWLHFAISRNNGTTSIFKNGIQIGSSYSDTNNINNTSTALSIGQESTPTANSYFPGYISNFRIVNGTAVYTSSFTPPTAPLTAIANTSLLTCNAATIVDSSTNNFTITNNNSATVSSVSPFVASSGGMSLKKVYADPVTSIVTSGLVLNLDASNASSYPGSGTSWNDLSGNGNNGTLVNGPTFNSANGGSIVFDGTNDYVDIGNISQLKPTTQITVSAWVYRSTMNDSQNEVIIGCTQVSGYALYYTENKMKFYVYAGGSYRIPEMSTSAISGWMNFTATYDNRYAKLYHNGVLQNTVDSGATNNISYVANNILIGAEAGAGSTRDSGFEWTGNIAQTLIYDRSLSESEVLQNYNVTKAKFGL
jgi:hypothetical protein